MINPTTPLVEEMSAINLSGNITPQVWFRRITFDSGKPHLLAVLILSDICYWYRKTEIRDEQTGFVVGTARKFRGDLLQRSYDDIAASFGCSKVQAIRAVKRLESLGLIKRVLRTVHSGGIALSNVLFIQPIPEEIQKFSNSTEGTTVHPSQSDTSLLESTPLPTSMQGPPYSKVGTYTETTTKTSTNTLSCVENPEPPPPSLSQSSKGLEVKSLKKVNRGARFLNASKETRDQVKDILEWYSQLYYETATTKKTLDDSMIRRSKEELTVLLEEGEPTERIKKALKFARTDSFWVRNLLSPAKLTERAGDGTRRYEQLLAKADQQESPVKHKKELSVWELKEKIKACENEYEDLVYPGGCSYPRKLVGEDLQEAKRLERTIKELKAALKQ